MRNILLALALVTAGCEQGKSKLDDLPAASKTTTGSASAAGDAIDIDSKDILDRKEAAADVQVKHVLIGWKELDDSVYHGRLDERAKKRTNADAAKLAKEIADKLRKDPGQIDALVKQYSEDPGSLAGDPYQVKADTEFVPEFKALALHLKLNEVGIVKSRFGYHVMERVPPPPPDPLESADVLARPAKPGTATIQHIVIGWKDTQLAKSPQGDPRAKTRTKEEADKLAQEVMAKAKAGGDMNALTKEYSEEPGAKDGGRTIPLEESSQVPAPFDNLKQLALRLEENEVGLVKSPLGWHVVKRVPPPPPDPLDSVDILKREPVTQKATVKHILLGWNEVNTGRDPRAKKRDRAALEKLVKDTVAKLKKGAKIEPLMAQLSEDEGSAKSGKSYDVTPDAGLVEPFKKLSLRLNKGEVGVVKTDFGIHIIQRVE